MLNLVLKDLLNIKRVLWLPVFYGFILIYAFRTMGEASLIAITIAVNYMFTVQACAHDDKNRSDMLLLSLPLSRKTVVGAKYLSAFLYAVLGILTYGAAWGIYRLFIVTFSLPPITGETILEGLALSLVFSCLYYPVYFRFGHLKSNIYGIVIFMLFTFVPGMVFGLLRHGSENPVLAQFIRMAKPWLSAAPNRPVILSLGFAVVLLAVSYLTSLRFYENREF